MKRPYKTYPPTWQYSNGYRGPMTLVYAIVAFVIFGLFVRWIASISSSNHLQSQNEIFLPQPASTSPFISNQPINWQSNTNFAIPPVQPARTNTYSNAHNSIQHVGSIEASDQGIYPSSTTPFRLSRSIDKFLKRHIATYHSMDVLSFSSITQNPAGESFQNVELRFVDSKGKKVERNFRFVLENEQVKTVYAVAYSTDQPQDQDSPDFH